MIPTPYFELARLIHEERIREAQRQRPEWMYEAALAARARHRASASRQIRISVAQVLRRLAASVEPSGSGWQVTNSRQPASE